MGVLRRLAKYIRGKIFIRDVPYSKDPLTNDYLLDEPDFRGVPEEVIGRKLRKFIRFKHGQSEVDVDVGNPNREYARQVHSALAGTGTLTVEVSKLTENGSPNPTTNSKIRVLVPFGDMILVTKSKPTLVQRFQKTKCDYKIKDVLWGQDMNTVRRGNNASVIGMSNHIASIGLAKLRSSLLITEHCGDHIMLSFKETRIRDNWRSYLNHLIITTNMQVQAPAAVPIPIPAVQSLALSPTPLTISIPNRILQSPTFSKAHSVRSNEDSTDGRRDAFLNANWSSWGVQRSIRVRTNKQFVLGEPRAAAHRCEFCVSSIMPEIDGSKILRSPVPICTSSDSRNEVGGSTFTPPLPPKRPKLSSASSGSDLGDKDATQTPPTTPQPSALSDNYDRPIQAEISDILPPLPPRPPKLGSASSGSDLGNKDGTQTPPTTPQPSALSDNYDRPIQAEISDILPPLPPRPPKLSSASSGSDLGNKDETQTQPTTPQPSALSDNYDRSIQAGISDILPPLPRGPPKLSSASSSSDLGNKDETQTQPTTPQPSARSDNYDRPIQAEISDIPPPLPPKPPKLSSASSSSDLGNKDETQTPPMTPQR